MKIQPNYFKYHQPANFKLQSFGSMAICDVQPTIESNIKNAKNGFIGITTIRDEFKNQVEVEIHKRDLGSEEFYHLKTKEGKNLGSIALKVKRVDMLDEYNYIYIENLNNKSVTDNHTESKFSGIGTRLMQIALQRSKEEELEGRIKLDADSDAIPFYENLGFVYDDLDFSINNNLSNSQRMFLPNENMDILENYHGKL